MSESSPQSPAAGPGDGGAGGGRRQRKLRNYLLDKKFQLKYTGIVIGVTAVLGTVLGFYLDREIVASQETILARDMGADEVVIEPGDVDARNELSDRIDQEFNDALMTKMKVIVSLNNAPAGSAERLYEQAFQDELATKRRVLVGALAVFLAALALVWIYLTHKIAGPVYKFKLLFSKIGGDTLTVVGRLRKGDELQEAFLEFERMIERLRERRRGEIKELDGILDELHTDGEAKEEAIASLRSLRDRIVGSLGD